MDGITDLATRLWLRLSSGIAQAFTPFLRVTEDYPVHRIPPCFSPAQERSWGLTVRPQLMGSCPDTLGRFIRHLLQDHDLVDINMGCPAPKVVGNNGGSGLIRCHKNLSSFLQRLFDQIPPGRVSVKTRLGFNHSTEAEDLVGILASFPIAELTLHGRTRAQRYQGQSDWLHIGRLSAQLNIPCAGSGDITSAERLSAAHAQAPSVGRILIGRGLLRNPWLGHEIRDNKPVSISVKTLSSALKTFFLINRIVIGHRAEGHRQTFLPDGLTERLQPLLMLGSTSGRQAEVWSEALSILLPFSPLTEASSRAALCRLKMLWSYLFTSLHPRFAEASLLRAPSPESFFLELHRIAAERSTQHRSALETSWPHHTKQHEHTGTGGTSGDGDDGLESLLCASHWDWRYAGEARPTGPLPTSKNSVEAPQ